MDYHNNMIYFLMPNNHIVSTGSETLAGYWDKIKGAQRIPYEEWERLRQIASYGH